VLGNAWVSRTTIRRGVCFVWLFILMAGGKKEKKRNLRRCVWYLKEGKRQTGRKGDINFEWWARRRSTASTRTMIHS